MGYILFEKDCVWVLENKVLRKIKKETWTADRWEIEVDAFFNGRETFFFYKESHVGVLLTHKNLAYRDLAKKLIEKK